MKKKIYGLIKCKFLNTSIKGNDKYRVNYIQFSQDLIKYINYDKYLCKFYLEQFLQ